MIQLTKYSLPNPTLIIYSYIQLEREWENNGRQGALPGLNELSRKEIDWDRLEELARQDKVTLFGGIRAEK